MNTALLAAVRVQAALDELAALKARSPAAIAAEERLAARLAAVADTLLDRIDRYTADNGTPRSETTALIALGDPGDLRDQILEILTDEVGAEALAAIEHVEHAVTAAAAKALPDALRPHRMDRRLAITLGRLADRTLGRLVGGTVDALVDAATVDIARDQLRAVLAERIQGELTQLSRHALGDARNDATETAERDLGVRWHQWHTAGDDAVRPAHADVDGEIAAVGVAFSNGWMRPGGLGCRCHLEPWFPPDGLRPPPGADTFRAHALVPVLG